MKGIMRFNTCGKLSPSYVGSFLILEKVGKVSYKLALPLMLSGEHNVFHVSLLWQYVPSPDPVPDLTPLRLMEKLTYEKLKFHAQAPHNG